MLTAILGLFKGWSLLSSIGGWFANAWAWATRNPAWSLCIVLGLASGLFWHEWAVKARQVATITAANATLRHDHDIEAATIQTLQSAVAKQDKQIKALGTASATAQAQGDQADQAALDRSKHRTDLSNQIAAAPPPAAAACRTPDAVMAAKGEL